METTALPEDLATCHGMIRELAASLRAAQRQVEQLGHLLGLLQRRLYGPRSERVDPGQLLLFTDPAGEPSGPSESPRIGPAIPRPPDQGTRAADLAGGPAP